MPVLLVFISLQFHYKNKSSVTRFKYEFSRSNCAMTNLTNLLAINNKQMGTDATVPLKLQIFGHINILEAIL